MKGRPRDFPPTPASLLTLDGAWGWSGPHRQLGLRLHPGTSRAHASWERGPPLTTAEHHRLAVRRKRQMNYSLCRVCSFEAPASLLMNKAQAPPRSKVLQGLRNHICVPVHPPGDRNRPESDPRAKSTERQVQPRLPEHLLASSLPTTRRMAVLGSAGLSEERRVCALRHRESWPESQRVGWGWVPSAGTPCSTSPSGRIFQPISSLSDQSETSLC